MLDPWIGKIPWRRKWQPTLVFLPGEFHGQRSLVGYSPWGRKRTRLRDFHFHFGTTQYPLHCILLAPHTSPDSVQKEAYRNTRRRWPQLPSEAAMVFWHPPLYPSAQFLTLCCHRQSSYLQTIQVDTKYLQVQFSSKRNLLKRYCWEGWYPKVAKVTFLRTRLKPGLSIGSMRLQFPLLWVLLMRPYWTSQGTMEVIVTPQR